MKLHQKIIIAGVCILGLVLHLNRYTYYPQRGASSDEYTYSFMGVSLLTRGIPSSWSNFSPYQQTKHYDLTIDHIYFWMVEPYFDHPPLNGLLVGAWAILNGQDSFEKIQLQTIRLVPIALSVLTTLLIFLIGRAIKDFKTGVWAGLIFATSTIMVMNTRVVFAENLLTPLFLLGIYLYSNVKKTISTKTTIVLGVLAGLAFWTKEAGLSVGGTFLLLFLMDRQKRKHILLFIGCIALSVLLYIAYATHYNAKLFWDILAMQSARPIGPQTLLLLLTKPIIVNKVFYDGWYLLGFLCLFFLFTDIRRYKLIVIPGFIYLLFQLVGINREGEMGWYMIPMFPFFALATSTVACEYLVKRNFVLMLFLVIVGFSFVQNLYEPSFGLTPTVYRVLVALLLGPAFALYLAASDRLWKKYAQLTFYTLIFISALQTYWYVHPA